MSDIENESLQIYLEGARKAARRTIPPRFRDKGFEKFNIEKPEHAGVARDALKWVKAFKPKESLGVVLQGVIGCGKTHLGCAMLQGLIDRDITNVEFVNVADLFLEIRDSWDNPETNESDIIERLLSRTVLFLDDLGAEYSRENAPDYVLERLYYLFERMFRDLKPTLILTTNLSFDALAKKLGVGHGERIISRLGSLVEPLGEFPVVDMRREGMRS